MIPQVLKNFNCFVDGKGYAGRAENVSLPKVTVKTEEFRAGGMDSSLEVDMGVEKLECSFTLAEYSADVMGLWGVIAGADKQFSFRGAVQRQGEDATAIIATVGGRVKELDPGDWKAGDKATLKTTLAVNYYRLNVNGTDVIEIDVINMKRVVNGVDQMASLRAALGI